MKSDSPLLSLTMVIVLIAGAIPLAGGWLVTTPQAEPPTPEPVSVSVDSGLVRVHADGSITGLLVDSLLPPNPGVPSRKVRLRFGLPQQGPLKRWLENDTLPICHTRWEQDGIRYSQTVFTMVSEEEAPADSPNHPLLLVHVAGENAAGEYTDAHASFAVEVGGQSLDLKMKDGLVYLSDMNKPEPAAAIAIPGEGIERSTGKRLLFRGHMPPGTSGGMTILLPASPQSSTNLSRHLQFLDYDLELWRARNFWLTQTNTPRQPPVRFSENQDCLNRAGCSTFTSCNQNPFPAANFSRKQPH